MNTGTRNDFHDAASGTAPRVDVQQHWRKRGWLPPTEYRRDFAQSCRPAIHAGMVRLEVAKAI